MALALDLVALNAAHLALKSRATLPAGYFYLIAEQTLSLSPPPQAHV